MSKLEIKTRPIAREAARTGEMQWKTMLGHWTEITVEGSRNGGMD
jgi:hypothetical protein